MVLLAGLGFILIVLALRYWVLPEVENYRDDIAAAITRASGQRVTIGRIAGDWEGLRPRLSLSDVQVFDRGGQPALALQRVENILSWRTLLYGEIHFHLLQVDEPNLSVRRDDKGVVYIAGIALNQPEAGSGFSDWLLRQHSVVVRNAQISWQDDKRGAPQLTLKSVNLRIENRGRRHRFGLTATPPGHLAAPIDLRGEFVGRTVSEWQDWHGELFGQLDYVDIAAWRTWLSFPVELRQGAGALRLWFGFRDAAVSDVTADIRLAGVKTRLAPELAELDMSSLHGRVGWAYREDGFEISTQRLSLVTQGGLTLRPVDFLLRSTLDRENKPIGGELRTNSLDLEPLVALAEHLPLNPEVRSRLAEISPRGSLHDVVIKWSGEWPAPRRYSAKGRFVDLGMKPFGKIPGFSGVSGSIDGTEHSGAFSLNSRGARVDLTKVFRDPLEFDTMTAQAGWKVHGDQTELKLSNVSFANPHLAGNVYGDYRTVSGSPGLIDLTGNLFRAEARHVGRYIPLVVNKDTIDWLDKAFAAGESNDVRLRLKGNLADFPFADGSRGTFQVSAKATGGILDYAKDWPKIENISVDLQFRGKRMEVYVPEASLFGAKLARVRAVIPDLLTHDEILQVDGEAEGPTGEFFKFIEASPVNGYIDGFTEGMRANGAGKLSLKLQIPFRHIQDTKVAGIYQFIKNQINPGLFLPNLEQVNGRIEFTESAVKSQNTTALIMGGPATVNAATEGEATVRINVSGRANADNLRRTSSHPWAKYLRGSADWRGVINVRKKRAEVLIESSLQGLGSDLPQPFAKPASDAVPLRFEKKMTGSQHDTLTMSYGKMVSAQFVHRREGDQSRIERGVVSVNAGPALPDRSGIWVIGSLPTMDLDHWQSVLNQAGSGAAMDLPGLDLKIGALYVFDRRFNDVQMSAVSQSGSWQSSIAGKEISGEINWRPQGKGKLTARLKNLTLAGAYPGRPDTAGAKLREKDLPALDVTVENFGFQEKQFGRLELLAQQQGRDWQIERLRINNPDSTLLADGTWQGLAKSPRTRVNVKLEVSDIGKFLARFGYPDGVKRGNGKLEGTLSWSGSPQAIDYPSLTGTIVIEAYNGQFVKIEPGIGKLLGILSLQALPRRITLDFRDVFSEGFEFGKISGSLAISRGVATTTDLKIRGSAARVAMSGEVNLAEETQKLRVHVTPSLGGGVSLAGSLIGGPVVGIATMIVSKALKDPLDQLAAYDYDVTGTWSEPNVAKVKAPPPAEEEKRETGG